MDIETWKTVLLMVGGFGGLTGLAAYVRARGQNSNEERLQLSKEQQEFRQSMAEQLSSIRTQMAAVEARNDVLEIETRRQGELIAGLTAQKEYQEKQLLMQADQIANLRQQNATQATQIAAVTEEKAGYAQRVQISEAQRSFLERENGELRREIIRLQAALPTRIEALTNAG